MNRLSRLSPTSITMPNMIPQVPTTNPLASLGIDPSSLSGDSNQNPLASLGMQPSDSLFNPGQSKLNTDTASNDSTGNDYATPLLDRYKGMLENAPKPEDFPVTRKQKILSSLAALGAGASPQGMYGGQPVGLRFSPDTIDFRNMMLKKPYLEAKGRYDEGMKQLEKGSEIEEKQLANKRLLEQTRTLNDIRQQQTDIKQQAADTAAKKEADIKDQKINELSEKVRKADEDRALKEQIANQNSANVQARIDAMRATQEAISARHELDLAQKDKVLNETIAQHQAERDNWKKEREESDRRLSILEQAGKDKQAGTTTTKEDKNVGGWTIPGLNWTIGGHKQTVTTKTVGKPGETLEVPIGAKPGGKWVDLPSGKKIYQEP